MARQDRTAQHRTRQDKTQDKTRQNKKRQDKTRQDKTIQDKTRRDETRQDTDTDTDTDKRQTRKIEEERKTYKSWQGKGKEGKTRQRNTTQHNNTREEKGYLCGVLIERVLGRMNAHQKTTNSNPFWKRTQTGQRDGQVMTTDHQQCWNGRSTPAALCHADPIAPSRIQTRCWVSTGTPQANKTTKSNNKEGGKGGLFEFW
jgi:hypothetical protein